MFSPSVASSLQEALKAEDLNLKLLIHIGNSYFSQPQLLPALNAYEQVLMQANIENILYLKHRLLLKLGRFLGNKKN